MASITITEGSLLHLMRLSSASLPVGGYSFSQGLEYAVESGWVTDRQGAAHWLRLILLQSIAQVDLPILQRLIAALHNNSPETFWFWNATLLACREHGVCLSDRVPLAGDKQVAGVSSFTRIWLTNLMGMLLVAAFH